MTVQPSKCDERYFTCHSGSLWNPENKHCWVKVLWLNLSSCVPSRCDARAAVRRNPVCLQRGGLARQPPAVLHFQLRLDRPAPGHRLRQLPVSARTTQHSAARESVWKRGVANTNSKLRDWETLTAASSSAKTEMISAGELKSPVWRLINWNHGRLRQNLQMFNCRPARNPAQLLGLKSCRGKKKKKKPVIRILQRRNRQGRTAQWRVFYQSLTTSSSFPPDCLWQPEFN